MSGKACLSMVSKWKGYPIPGSAITGITGYTTDTWLKLKNSQEWEWSGQLMGEPKVIDHEVYSPL